MLDERLTPVTETLAGSVAASIEAKLDGSMAALAARNDEQARLIDARTGETVSAIDRNLIRMVDALDEHFERLGAGVGDRAASAAELAIGARFDDVLARLHAAASVIERENAETRGAIEQTRSHLDETRSALDTRFVALAKLVRSDSETLAGQIVADQDVTKQALRAMKELQASLPPRSSRWSRSGSAPSPSRSSARTRCSRRGSTGWRARSASARTTTSRS
jgi:hypothetical protein